MSITLHHGLPVGLEAEAARLYWQAFGEKLGKLLGPAERGIAFFTETIHHDAILAAVGPDGDLLGIVAHQANGKGFSDGGTQALWRHYRWGMLWRLIPLGLLERTAPEGVLQMDGICVSEKARGQGVGSALFEALFTMAHAQGFEKITLDVINTNPRALYERLGFVAIGQESTGPMRPLLGFDHAERMTKTF